MKKLFLLGAFFVTLFSTTVLAQGGPGGDPAVMRQKMKERVKPQLIEKTKLTDEKAEKALDVYIDMQAKRRELRMDNNLSDDDKKKKQTAIDEELEKKYKAIPLSDEEIKAVNEFFDEMRKNAPQRRQGGNN